MQIVPSVNITLSQDLHARMVYYLGFAIKAMFALQLMF